MATVLMREVYFDPEHPISFSGVNKLYYFVKEKYPKIKVQEVKDFLKSIDAYTLTKPCLKKFPTNKMKANAPGTFAQCDLLDYQSYAAANGGTRYLVCLIDVFSRFSFIEPIPNKTGPVVRLALEKILDRCIPFAYFCTDAGREFDNVHVKELLDIYGIGHVILRNTPKAAIVERYQKSLRILISRYQIFTRNVEYVSQLEKFAFKLNNSAHKALNYKTPHDVYKTKEVSKPSKKLTPKTLPADYSVGSFVRISYLGKKFRKIYHYTYTEEIFKIFRINLTSSEPLFYLETITQPPEKLEGFFYKQEISPVSLPDYYTVDKILETKGRGKNKKHLVKFVHYEQPEWINDSDLMDIEGS